MAKKYPRLAQMTLGQAFFLLATLALVTWLPKHALLKYELLLTATTFALAFGVILLALLFVPNPIFGPTLDPWGQFLDFAIALLYLAIGLSALLVAIANHGLAQSALWAHFTQTWPNTLLAMLFAAMALSGLFGVRIAIKH